jgi:hypothetical protein
VKFGVPETATAGEDGFSNVTACTCGGAAVDVDVVVSAWGVTGAAVVVVDGGSVVVVLGGSVVVVVA